MPSDPKTTGRQIKVEAAILDPEDGESGIVEIYSGRVLAWFASLSSAKSTLRKKRDWYEAKARGEVS